MGLRLNTWEPAIREHLRGLSSYSSIPVVYCGDNNIANKEDVWFGDCLSQNYYLNQTRQKKDNFKKNRIQKSLHDGTTVLCGYSKAEQNAYKRLLEECKLTDCFRLKNKEIVDKFTWFNIRILKVLKIT